MSMSMMQMSVSATVNGGETMEVMVNGQQMAVQVPQGVKIGESFSFQVQAPPVTAQPIMAQPVMAEPMMGQPVMAQPVMASAIPGQQPMMMATPAGGSGEFTPGVGYTPVTPKRQWKKGLCECCSAGGMCCAACCCPFITGPQLFQKFTGKKGSCKQYAAIMLVLYILYQICNNWQQNTPTTDPMTGAINPAWGIASSATTICYIGLLLVGTFVLMTVRKLVRDKDQIPTGGCGEAEDCCCSFWCSVRRRGPALACCSFTIASLCPACFRAAAYALLTHALPNRCILLPLVHAQCCTTIQLFNQGDIKCENGYRLCSEEGIETEGGPAV